MFIFSYSLAARLSAGCAQVIQAPWVVKASKLHKACLAVTSRAGAVGVDFCRNVADPTPFVRQVWARSLHRYRNLSLRAKFALPIALFVVLLFGALIPGVLYLQTRTVLDGARERGLDLTKIFAHSSVQAVVSDDFLALRQMINSMASEQDVLYAMILDSQRTPAGAQRYAASG